MHHETTPGARGGAPTGPATPAVDVSGIARRFGRRWALRGVDLRVEAGEAVALQGRNGSGKTTLLRILSTALRPTQGQGRLFGHDLLQEGRRIRELVGMLGHSPGLYGDLTAAENLRFALQMAGQDFDPSRIAGALEAVGLEREAHERVRGFSAGMQRRLSLARLMLRRPRLVLLDEPYASFDVEGIAEVNQFLTELKGAGHAVIVATHDLPRARAVVDRVVEIVRGRGIERGAVPRLDASDAFGGEDGAAAVAEERVS